MGHRRSATHWFNLFGAAGLVLAALVGCSGDDGATGSAGSNAVVGGTTVSVASLSQSELQNLEFSRADSKVTSVSINSAPVVNFTVKDSTGRGVVGLENFWSQSSPTALKSYTNIAFALAKLVPAPAGTNAPNRWVSYIVTTTATPPSVTRPSTDNNGVLTGDGNGNYTYTFYRDITQTASIVAGFTDTSTNKKADVGDTTYQPTLTHRLTIQIGGNVRGTGSNTPNGVTSIPGVPMQHPINIIYDFIPATGQVVSSSDESRNIVDVSACFQCHGVFTWHGGDALDGAPGSRQDTKYCVVCHTEQRKFGRTASVATGTPPTFTGRTYRVDTDGYDAFGTGESWGQSLGLLPRLIHKIHKGEDLYVQGYDFAGVAFNEVTFPQDRRDCRKCHTGPDGDNFKNKPNRAACGACHDNLNFDTGANALRPAHSVQTNDQFCSTCHTPQAIEDKHLTVNYTPTNPSAPAGALHITYEIASVTTSDPALPDTHKQPVVKFRILSGASAAVTGTPVTLICNGSSSTTADTLLSGFSGSPSFVVAFAAAQNGVTPADYNNLGNAAGQPATVSIANVCNGTQGSMAGPDASGYYTATITGATRGYPAGSTLRAVALQGYFTQVYTTDRNGDGFVDANDNLARHAISVVKGVTGDPQRRAIIDPTKCGNCHEWLELHGGNRVIGVGSDPTQPVVCLTCHNPNLSSSGQTAGNPPTAATQARLVADGYSGTDTATWPEAGMNFKNLIHQIHGSHKRTNEFRFLRNFNNTPNYYNFSHVTFPGILRNCETCHKAGTAGGYNADLPAGALPTTNITVDRANVPNLNDDVTLPFLATCVGCHDDSTATAHMAANGGVVSQRPAVAPGTATRGLSSQLRSVAISDVEQCSVCHGPGRVAAVTEVHARR